MLANLIVAGGGILIRAAAQAYKQAIVSEFPDLPLSEVLLTMCLLTTAESLQNDSCERWFASLGTY